MKNFWKALGIAALAAAIPVRIKKDDATGKKQYQSLLLSVDVGPGESGEGTDIGINFGEGVINSAIMGAVNAKREASLFTDDPDEAVPFAGDEPNHEAEDANPVSDEADEIEESSAEQPAGPADTEEDFDPDL